MAIKLTYFNVKGIGEPIRMLLKYGGIDFEDKRIEHESWPELKPKMPFGQMPIYGEGGKTAHQSIAITRYVAKMVKLVGETDWENLEIDSVVDTITDLRAKIALYSYEQDPAIKMSRKEPLMKETIPYYLKRLDKIAEKNGGHLAIGKLTWADIFFVGVLDYLNFISEQDLTEGYSNLIAVKDNVVSILAIKQWIESRPQTDM